jgi:hypothetical protein
VKQVHPASATPAMNARTPMERSHDIEVLKFSRICEGLSAQKGTGTLPSFVAEQSMTYKRRHALRGVLTLNDVAPNCPMPTRRDSLSAEFRNISA